MGKIHVRRRVLLLAAVALAVDSSATAQPAGKGPESDYFNPKNFNPSMAILMVVLVTAFFLLGFFSIYIRRCVGPPLGGPEPNDDEYPVAVGLPATAATAASRSRSRRTRGGLDRSVLESFPTMAYADVRAHRAADKGALECAVCLTDFDDDDVLRLLPACAHAFHADCIDAWLASHVTCPVCRAVLSPAPALAAAAAAVPVPAAAAATEHDDDQVIPPPEPEPEPDQAVVVVVDAPDAAAAGGTGTETETETEEERVRREEAAELMRIGSVKRALRSKSKGRRRRPAEFRRSHTTGHLLHSPASASASASDDSERYTLRLPDHVLREAVAAAAAGNLRRSASVQMGTGAGDTDGTTTTVRRGFGIARSGRSRSVRLGNSGRWPSMSLLARTFSVWGGSSAVRRGEAKFAAGDDAKAVEQEQCDGGACSLAAHV